MAWAKLRKPWSKPVSRSLTLRRCEPGIRRSESGTQALISRNQPRSDPCPPWGPNRGHGDGAKAISMAERYPALPMSRSRDSFDRHGYEGLATVEMILGTTARVRLMHSAP